MSSPRIWQSFSFHLRHLAKPANLRPANPTLRRTYTFRPYQPPSNIYRRFQDGNASYNNTYKGQTIYGFPAKTVYLLGGGTVLGGLFYVSNLETVQETGRSRFMIIGEESDRALGEQSEKAILAQYGNQILADRHPTTIYVNRVAQRLLSTIHSTEPVDRHLFAKKSDVKWKVAVIKDDSQLNAFVLPNGFICIFTGILPICANEDGLAVVLGHEISHQLLRHSAERLSSNLLSLLVSIALAYAFDISAQNLTSLSNLLLELPNSRAQETEADRVGLRLMARACYNPHEAISLWQRMKAVQGKRGGHVPALLSTHPTDAARIQRMTNWMPEAVEQRNEHCSQAHSFWSVQSSNFAE